MRSLLRVLIADDHPVVHAGLPGMLAGQPDFVRGDGRPAAIVDPVATQGDDIMHLTGAIPAMPVLSLTRSLPFYCDQLGFTLVHCADGFAIVRRDAVEIHLWEANDQTWRSRTGTPPVVSGAETFLAGTASCRVAVKAIDELYASLVSAGILHPHAPLATRPWGAREFGVLDPDRNLITFFERVS